MLNVITLDEALRLTEQMNTGPLGSERVPLRRAYGRYAAEDVVSAEDIPGFDRATMDGYAVRACDTFGAGAAIPSMLDIAGEIPMGQPAERPLQPGQCVKISTGGMLPPLADAVVPVELTDTENADLCLCYQSLSPGQNVALRGDDLKTGETVISRGSLITPALTGVLAAAGIAEVNVFHRPRVGIVSTGDELVGVDRPTGIGQVRDVNSHVTDALCSSYGCDCRFYGILRDDESLLTRTLRAAAAENDVVLLSGGSSAGEADRTAAVISALGTLLCHGIAVKPGKPTIIGKIGDAAVFGLPGHPAACFFVTSVLVKRYIMHLYMTEAWERTVTAALTEHVSSNHGREELICVKLRGGTAQPVYAKSGVISVLNQADGYFIVPRDCEGLQKGTEVKVILF